MNKKIIIITLVLIAVIFVGTVFYYNVIINNRNSQITSLNNQVENLNNEVSNLTAQVSNLINMTRSNENITFVNVNSYVAGTGYGEYNWTLSLDLENTGSASAIINNIIIEGKSYSSINPVPIVTPSIQNGYALSPNQSVTITLKDADSTLAPSDDSTVYVLTAVGNSYSYYFGS